MFKYISFTIDINRNLCLFWVNQRYLLISLGSFGLATQARLFTIIIVSFSSLSKYQLIFYSTGSSRDVSNLSQLVQSLSFPQGCHQFY